MVCNHEKIIVMTTEPTYQCTSCLAKLSFYDAVKQLGEAFSLDQVRPLLTLEKHLTIKCDFISINHECCKKGEYTYSSPSAAADIVRRCKHCGQVVPFTAEEKSQLMDKAYPSPLPGDASVDMSHKISGDQSFTTQDWSIVSGRLLPCGHSSKDLWFTVDSGYSCHECGRHYSRDPLKDDTSIADDSRLGGVVNQAESRLYRQGMYGGGRLSGKSLNYTRPGKSIGEIINDYRAKHPNIANAWDFYSKACPHADVRVDASVAPKKHICNQCGTDVTNGHGDTTPHGQRVEVKSLTHNTYKPEEGLHCEVCDGPATITVSSPVQIYMVVVVCKSCAELLAQQLLKALSSGIDLSADTRAPGLTESEEDQARKEAEERRRVQEKMRKLGA